SRAALPSAHRYSMTRLASSDHPCSRRPSRKTCHADAGHLPCRLRSYGEGDGQNQEGENEGPDPRPATQRRRAHRAHFTAQPDVRASRSPVEELSFDTTPLAVPSRLTDPPTPAVMP